MSEAFFACQGCLNRRVRVFMRNGDVFAGTITGVDRNNFFLRAEDPRYFDQNRAFISGIGFFGGGAILTLALFDLLAIALLV